MELNFARDVQGFNAFAPELSDVIYDVTLSSGDHQEFIVPSSNEKWTVIFSYQFGADIYVSVNNIASNPAGSTFQLTTSQMVPAQLTVFAGDSISCFNNNAIAQDVGVALYAIP